MRFAELAKRNLREAVRDPLSVGVTLALPLGLMLVLSLLGRRIADVAPQLSATMLAPGMTLFGFAMLVFSSGFLLARDRENALLTRLLTAPLRPSDFIAAYSLPYLPVAIAQMVGVFAIGGFLGLAVTGNAGLVFLVLFLMSIGYIGLGMLLGSVLSSQQVGFAYAVVLIPTIFAGTWFELEIFGEGFTRAMNALPFAHALAASRDVMAGGAGFRDIASDLSWVLGYTVVFFALGVLAFRRRMVE
jgi:ABC-2 type transport system permease protein